MLCRHFKFPLPCSSALPLDEKHFSRLLFIIIIHTGNLDLSKGILPFATSSVDDAGFHFLAFYSSPTTKKLFFSFPPPVDLVLNQVLAIFSIFACCLDNNEVMSRGRGNIFLFITIQEALGRHLLPF